MDRRLPAGDRAKPATANHDPPNLLNGLAEIGRKSGFLTDL
jgi:hypothetical protein